MWYRVHETNQGVQFCQRLIITAYITGEPHEVGNHGGHYLYVQKGRLAIGFAIDKTFIPVNSHLEKHNTELTF